MNAGDGTISLIDPVKRAAMGQITVGGALEYVVTDGADRPAQLRRADRLALVGGRSRLITACANKVALVVNAASGAIMTSLPIGEGPDAVLVDAARGLAFVPCGKSGTLVELSILDRDHIALVGTIAGQRAYRLDRPAQRKNLAACASFGPPAAGNKHGPMVAGSFDVLVLASGT